ncbi:hypothetical protein SMSP2_00082 [Limihaloglobus sulfuriphilus]|uniref:DUF642 domain-containing protein n=1 Tax=Limihaloglobus sulfuriphilus TaxID=1851148 RepID=A0A1Q2MB39_9BACT|nr:choice-of-anchor C family protein [Limihaloglobus sulfuriphilus]AQQ69748.1 hypothetical protein SMSP2_00082 [Limihaloglobus sulfuriphilus]
MCKLLTTLMFACAICANAMVTNGGFEAPDASGNSSGFTRYGPGLDINGWVVIQSVDLVNELWPAYSGEQSLDLNASSPGIIAQELQTVPGATYELSFMLAANPTTPYPPTMKLMRTKIADAPVGAFIDYKQFNFDAAGRTYQDMGWREEIWLFTAQKESTWLIFESLNNGECGVALDDIAVNLVQIPEPATLVVLAVGGLLARKRK